MPRRGVPACGRLSGAACSQAWKKHRQPSAQRISFKAGQVYSGRTSRIADDVARRLEKPPTPDASSTPIKRRLLFLGPTTTMKVHRSLNGPWSGLLLSWHRLGSSRPPATVSPIGRLVGIGIQMARVLETTDNNRHEKRMPIIWRPTIMGSQGADATWSFASDTTGTQNVWLRSGRETSPPVTSLSSSRRCGRKSRLRRSFGGTITLTLGLVITNGSVDKADIKEQVAVIALLLSLALYLAAVDADHTSLMPSVFWRQWTRPFNATLAIHDEMIRVWKGLFLPATVMLALGLFSLALGVMKPGWVEWAPPDWAMGVGLVAAVALFVWCRRSRPPMLRCNAPKAEQRWVENAQTRAKWESESMPSNRQWLDEVGWAHGHTTPVIRGAEADNNYALAYLFSVRVPPDVSGATQVRWWLSTRDQLAEPAHAVECSAQSYRAVRVSIGNPTLFFQAAATPAIGAGSVRHGGGSARGRSSSAGEGRVHTVRRWASRSRTPASTRQAEMG